jgi:transketolase
MRDAFIAELTELASTDSKILLMVGDIGFKVFDRYRDLYPDNFINCGIAEANMIGMSAGLAMSGYKPIVYTIVPFLTMRAFEQIRVDLCIHNQNVVLVGVGGGLAYDVLGPTHHSIEDVAILRALPQMEIVVPRDPAETKLAIAAALKRTGPVYVRLGKNGEPNLGEHFSNNFEFGKANILRDGNDVAFIGCGPILKIALEAASDLQNRTGISCKVVDMHTVKPVDTYLLQDLSKKMRAIATIEEHSIIGGLGSAVAEELMEIGCNISFKRFGIADKFTKTVGKQSYLFEQHGLTKGALVDWILEVFYRDSVVDSPKSEAV